MVNDADGNFVQFTNTSATTSAYMRLSAHKIAADSVTLAKLGPDVGTVAVQSSPPSDTNVKLWIQI